MTETKSKYLEDLARYQYGDVAGRLGSDEKTAPFMKGALEKLIDSFDIDKDILSGLKEGAFASEQGIATATQIYAEKYQNALKQTKVMEFYEVRSSTLKSLLGDEKAEESKAVFEKYQDQTIGSILNKFEQAQEKIKSKNGLFDEKAKAEAKKTSEKLAPIYNLITLLEQRNYEELRNGATKSTYKEMINEFLRKAV